MSLRLPLRTVLFRLHWALGLSAGFVLALTGLTGALMSYEEALTAFANRDRATVAVSDRPRLGPEALVARIEAQVPGLRVSGLTLPGEPEASLRARFGRDPRTGERPPSVYVDPADGTVLGPARWEAGFATIRALHRWLLVPGDGKGWGRTVTGACTLALIAFLGSGLYLRWPQVHRWRIWFRPHLARPGRARWWSLHAVAGTWLMPIYLVSALSGLWWSYDWYKAGASWLLTGQGRGLEQGQGQGPRSGRVPGREGPEKPKTPPALDGAWAAFRAGEGRAADGRAPSLAILTLPGRDGAEIRIRWPAHPGDRPGAFDEATFDSRTGAPLAVTHYADKRLGARIVDDVLEVHRGRFFGEVAAFLFFLAALAMPGFAATGLTLYVLRRRAARRRRQPPAGGDGTVEHAVERARFAR